MLHICHIALAVSLTVALPLISANAQEYPDKPIRLITSEAGGGQDIIMRILAPSLATGLNQPVVIDNRPSALTGELLSKATPDGYTIASVGSALWLTPLLQQTAYDASQDFAPITLAARWPYLLVVSPSLPVKSVRELIELAKAKPGSLNAGATAAPGGASFLGTELFKSMAHVNIVRVPYKGNGFALNAILAGEAHLMFNDIGAVSAQVSAGKVRALAVTSLEPSPLVPGLPTVASSGVPGFEVISMTAILTPAKTPPNAINRLNREFVRFLNQSEVKERLLAVKIEAVTSAPAELTAIIKADTSKWAKVLADAGVKVEFQGGR